MAVVLGLVAMAALVGGSALIWAHTTERDADGSLKSPSYDLVTVGYAITSLIPLFLSKAPSSGALFDNGVLNGEIGYKT